MPDKPTSASAPEDYPADAPAKSLQSPELAPYWLTAIPEGHSDEEPSIIARLRAGERIEHYETVRVRKDGTLVDISLTVSPIRDADGRIIGASKIARDITERKRARAEA